MPNCHNCKSQAETKISQVAGGTYGMLSETNGKAVCSECVDRAGLWVGRITFWTVNERAKS